MKTMKNKDELQRDIEQFDFRLVRETKVSKNAAGGLTIRHLPPDSTRQWNEVRRFRDFVESNWTVREIDFAASFHPAGKFFPHEDADALTTRTKIDNTDDECLIEKREPTEVNYAGFGFATWTEADVCDKALCGLQRDALMLLGAAAALELHGADFRDGFIKNNIDGNKDSLFDKTIAQLRHEVANAVKKRTR